MIRAALADAKVTGEVVEQFKGEKAIIFKFKKRKGYKRLKGHRQNLTKVRITDVCRSAAEKPKAKKAAAKKAAAKERPRGVRRRQGFSRRAGVREGFRNGT